MSDTAPRFDVQPDVSSHFSWLRTQMSLQRTLMSAVRTSVSLIGFGFTVAQFFQRLQSTVAHPLGPALPRDLGLVLIGAGVISLAVFTWQYHVAQTYLRGAEFEAITLGRKRPMYTSVYLIALTVIAIGVVAFGSVFIRL